MTDYPIIFSAPMVLALLEGRKTMTRRLAWRESKWADEPLPVATLWQRVKPGDRLWVREAHLLYAMGGTQVCAYSCTDSSGRRGPWRPSIHMPRWASRLTLTVTATKIERLCEISADDATAEGIHETAFYENAEAKVSAGAPWSAERLAFADLWGSLHGAGAWDANPVVALTFTVAKANIDKVAA